MSDRYGDELIGNERPRHRAGDDSTADTSALRAGIAETRERMSDTLDEIGSRLNPHVVKEQVTQRVREGIREATIGRVEHMTRQAVDKVNGTRHSLADTIRDNPIPAAMVAIGLGWLLVNRSSSLNGSRERVSDAADAARERVGDAAVAARDRVSDMTSRVRERAADAGHAVRERAGMLADRTRDTAENVRTQAHHLASNAADRTRQSAARVEDMYNENPLALGAVSLALGVAAGFAVPRTDREVQFFGDARDQVVDRARAVIDETKEKVQHVASRVVEEAKTAAREEGLPGV